MKKIISAFLFFIIPLFAVSQENAGYTKELGDKAYSESRYNDAIDIYEAVIAEQGASLPLYYNLGNAYYRSNQLGKAILNYERALGIDAFDEDTRANLEFVQEKIVDKVPMDEIPFYKEWGNSLISLLSKDTWAVVGIVTFIVMLLMFFFYLCRSNMRKISLTLVIISFAITVISNISAYNLGNSGSELPEGIILDEMVVVRSSPDSSGTELTKIHEGLKVIIIDDALSDWVKIEANNGNRVVGWVKTKSLERI